jgi:hypothetical protein
MFRKVEAPSNMNGYGLAAEIIKALASLAWPIAFVVAVLLFRERLKELLPLFRLKHKDWEASFRLDRAEEEAAQLPATPDTAIPPTPEERSRFEQIAEHSPRAAILEKRVELDQAIASLLHRDSYSKPISLSQGLRLLRSQGMIDGITSALLDDLRVIGNRAAHDGAAEFTKDEALRFGRLADQALAQLRRIEM